MSIELIVNGVSHEVEVEGNKPLLWVLREELGLMGAKYGCGIGYCRACSVVVDGQLVRSCLYSVGSLEGKAIQTIEGLKLEPLVQRLQDAWVSNGVSQCGYCQPGQIVSAFAFLKDYEYGVPTDTEIDRGISNLCRCGTYQRIRTAIKEAASADGGSNE